MSKNKIQLEKGMDVDGLLVKFKEAYAHEKVTTVDGVKVDFAEEWVHLRKSNTEPIIRVYTESVTQVKADALAERIMAEVKGMV